MRKKQFDIITLFPHILDSYYKESLLHKAQQKGLLRIVAHNPRDFTTDKHNTADDTPYGGGPGMVLKAEPIAKAVAFAKRKANLSGQESKKRKRVILFSLRGKKFNQKEAHRLAAYDQLIFICGRYEGVDERVAQYIADEELSIGDYVLSGGELPAAVVIEAVSRLIHGVLGKQESLEEVKGTYSVYTKPESVMIGGKKRTVPKVLLSGNHKEIDTWRIKHS